METIKDAIIITKENNLFDNIRFVLSALSKDPTRLSLNCMLVQKNNETLDFVATDGRSMHYFNYDVGMFDDGDGVAPEVIEAGMYRLISQTSKLIVIAPNDIDLKYPAWRDTIPKGDLDMAEQVDSSDFGKIILRCGSLFNPSYLCKALGLTVKKAGSSIHVEFGHDSSRSGLHLSHELGHAIVMPMLYDQDESSDESSDSEDGEKEDSTMSFDFVAGLVEGGADE